MKTDRTELAKAAILLSVGVAALVVGTAADGRSTTRGDAAVVVKLKPKLRSGVVVVGTARLTPVGAKHFKVVLRLTKRMRGRLPAHIHTGPCRREPTVANPRILTGLQDVLSGRSVTTVTTTTWAETRARWVSINVHSPNYAIVACGDLPSAR